MTNFEIGLKKTGQKFWKSLICLKLEVSKVFGLKFNVALKFECFEVNKLHHKTQINMLLSWISRMLTYFNMF